MIKKILNKLAYYTRNNRINYIKTIIINFAFFPFRTAIKLPILIYGPCRINSFAGNIEFTEPITKGMIRIGESDLSRSCFSKSFLDIRGRMVIGKNVVFRRGISLLVEGSAVFYCENDVFIGDNNTIRTRCAITIKRATRIGNNSVFMDSDYHYIIDINSREINCNEAPIIIGENNWIGGQCTIKKGTITPKGTVLAGPYSMLSKNYIGKIPEYSILAGSPAKLLKEGIRRVVNYDSEKKLLRYFSNTKNKFVLNEDSSIEEFCRPLN